MAAEKTRANISRKITQADQPCRSIAAKIHGTQLLSFEGRTFNPILVAIVKHAKLIVYPGAPHGITDTHKDPLNADLLAFIEEGSA